MRVVRFYQSACPPAASSSSSSSSSTSCPPRLRLFHLHFRLVPTLPTRRQALRQLPSSVRTAGPQPASCPAQCAPLDLNLRAAQLSVHRWTSTGDLPSSVRGPSQLSVHRWTSTWDLPSSVCTAGPQPGTCPAQCGDLPSSVCTAGPQPGT